MSPVGDLSAVAAAGRQAGAMYLSLLDDPETAQTALAYLGGNLATNLGHGDTFDHQRQSNHVSGFRQLPQFKSISNINVGLFAQQAGLTLNETLTIAGKFARVFSRNARPDQPYGLEQDTTHFITTGFNPGQSGALGKPAIP